MAKVKDLAYYIKVRAGLDRLPPMADVMFMASIVQKSLAKYFERIFADTPATGTITAGTNQITLPSDFTSPPIKVLIDGKNYEYVEEKDLRYVQTKNVVYVRGTTMYVLPEPGSDASYSILYIRTPAPLIAEDSDLEIPDEFFDDFATIVAEKFNPALARAAYSAMGRLKGNMDYNSVHPAAAFRTPGEYYAHTDED